MRKVSVIIITVIYYGCYFKYPLGEILGYGEYNHSSYLEDLFLWSENLTDYYREIGRVGNGIRPQDFQFSRK